MLKNSVTLESLLETHDTPFVIIDASLNVVAVNKAWELHFGLSRERRMSLPCCHESGKCRHSLLFKNIEPYVGLYADKLDNQEQRLLRVRGYPLLDSDGQLYLGESLIISGTTSSVTESPRMIGTSPGFLKLKTKLQQAAQSHAAVMLNGETGTGKELAAEYIHRQSKNANGEFVVVDCTILNEDLFESELFGHEKGSFTGAAGVKKGLFELANQGTLFLDEIGELPLSLQPKLLRALESGQFRRVGGTTTLKSTVRVVSATHRNLAAMVKEGRFREDLFYRLAVFPIEIPPLRDRSEDMPLLVQHLLEQIGQKENLTFRISIDALMKLNNHKWPGNIRELKNCLQLAASLCKNDQIEALDVLIMRRQSQDSNVMKLDRRGQSMGQQSYINPMKESTPHFDGDFSVNVTANGFSGSGAESKNLTPMEIMEAEFIRQLIGKYQGNRKLIATEMNVSERTLYRKLNRLNLN
ncbi:sigma-54-dependent Fis family transcriptional regulator [Methylicorpusculum sp.]|uniref:sigma-54 interaction domain-containing protein n=2 Tax=Methylicorpusculum sp. TaxID=2713644 RepID=UPI00271D8469|nr:sigma 54-interacting transcriptional regulator [Methylicorpusculum sp.]MDO8843023.1 sigma 54-interacting transcriptional regulator [Methylicorpusculum sp.]MDP2178941.1 sigma 54-interacting transcriptional regulator [Methylicorpusculum sp.]MDP3530954.1 sigma 54-interacting transcriptional regulator [Methylicorpusculum sp.]